MARKPSRPDARPAPLPVSLRLSLGKGVALGPGKADLMAAIQDTGSIAAAGRRLGMSYQRAHDLVAALNQGFAAPLVEATVGGSGGGGARLSALGAQVLAAYRAAEADALAATAPRLAWLRAQLRG